MLLFKVGPEGNVFKGVRCEQIVWPGGNMSNHLWGRSWSDRRAVVAPIEQALSGCWMIFMACFWPGLLGYAVLTIDCLKYSTPKFHVIQSRKLYFCRLGACPWFELIWPYGCGALTLILGMHLTPGLAPSQIQWNFSESLASIKMQHRVGLLRCRSISLNNFNNVNRYACISYSCIIRPEANGKAYFNQWKLDLIRPTSSTHRQSVAMTFPKRKSWVS